MNTQKNRKRLAIGLFLSAIVGTGLISSAALTDNLAISQQYNIASVDLQASPDGTTFTESATLTWPAIKSGIAYEAYNKLQVKNSGTAALNYTIATSRTAATGISWGAVSYDISKIASAGAACDATTVFSTANRPTGKTTAWGIASEPATTGVEALNSNQVQFLCIKSSASSSAVFADSDVATFTVTLAGTAQ